MALSNDQCARDDPIEERIFDGSIIESASSVRARDWRSYMSKSDSRYDTSSRNSNSSHQQTSSESTRKTGMILALTEGRGNAKGEIGLAAMECTGSTLYLYQFPDRCTYSHLLTKLEILDPVEIILPSSICEGPNTSLMELIISFKSDILITKIERRFFCEAEGLKIVRTICYSEYLNKLDIEAREKYYCLSAAAALVKYMESFRNMAFAPNSTKIVYAGSELTISIDPTTAKALEIIVNQDSGKSNSTLFAFLNFAKTRSGFRLLRATLREPLRDLKTIEARLDLVSELVSTPELQIGIADVLSKLLDIEQIISFIIAKPRLVDWKVGEKQIEISYMTYFKPCVPSMVRVRNH